RMSRGATMPAIIACRSCGSKLKVPDNLGRRKAQCPKCGGIMSLSPAAAPAAGRRPGPRPNQPDEAIRPAMAAAAGSRPRPGPKQPQEDERPRATRRPKAAPADEEKPRVKRR